MLTRLLAQFVVNSSCNDLTPAIVAAAKRGVIDCIAVTLAGSREQVAAILQNRVRQSAGNAKSTVIGGGFKTDAQLAAYANGAAAHALDYDDVIHVGQYWMGHPSVVIFPAVLAVAETTQATGKELLLAYALGIELYARLGLLCGDQPYRNGWHNTSYIGTLAAAGAVAKLLQLDEQQTRHAFGIAASMAGGLRQNFGTMTKPLHAGIAARNGVEAAQLAQAGLTADANILEAPLGFRNVFTASRGDCSQHIPQGEAVLSAEEFTAGLGNPWIVADPGLAFKICPSCRATHFGMEAALEFRESADFSTQHIVEIEAHVPNHMQSVLFYHAPQKGLEGKFSLEYVLARTLLDGVPKINDFTDARVNEPPIKQLIDKIRWIPFEPAKGSFGTPEFVFTLSNSEVFRSKVEYPRGEPENPVSDPMLIAKFIDCASTVLTADACSHLKGLLLDLENVDNITKLSRLLG